MFLPLLPLCYFGHIFCFCVCYKFHNCNYFVISYLFFLVVKVTNMKFTILIIIEYMVR